MIYFDNSSTSFPKAPGIQKALDEYINNYPFNISRGNYRASYTLEEKVYNVRESIKAFFNASETSNVVFTSGVTASLNTFIRGFHKQGDHVLVSPMEHNAVMRPLEAMRKDGTITYTVIDKDDIFTGNIKKYIKPNTTSLIVNHASNVTGDVIDINALGIEAKRCGLAFAVDSAQSAGEINIDARNIDFLAFTAHKGLLSLQGIGGAVISKGVETRIKPLVFGGTGSRSSSFEMPNFLPDKFEAGTGNIPGIIALGEGINYINTVTLDRIHEHKIALRDEFIKGVSEIDNFEVVSLQNNDFVGVVSLIHKNKDLAEISNSLDRNFNICTRVGLHCAPLLHRTLGTFEKGGTLRFSFSYFNTSSEVKECILALKTLA